MTNIRTILAYTAAAVTVLLLPPSASADEALTGGLAECAAISDDTRRLACFDALASRQATEQTPAPAAVASRQATEPPPGFLSPHPGASLFALRSAGVTQW